VVIATGTCPGLAPLDSRLPAPLFPLVDRPFIQHVVERLVEGGISEFDFILSHLPEKIESLLGNGTRWGSAFRFHLVRDASRPGAAFRRLALVDLDEPVLLVYPDRLPHFCLARDRLLPQVRPPVLFCWRDMASARFEDRVQWAGWAWLPGRLLARLPEELDEHQLAALLLAVAQRQGSLVEVGRPLSARSFPELLEAHRRVLTGQFPELLIAGREAEREIRLARNVGLHPTARLIPPVYLGENCRVGAGARIGPNVSVGGDCVLDARCAVENAVVFPGSYVGEGLELSEAIADRECLVSLRVGAAVSVQDDFILGSLREGRIGKKIAGACSRLAAGALLLVAWPVLLATALYLKETRQGRVLYKKEVVHLPAPPDRRRWRTFHLWSFCPEGAPEEKTGPRHFLLRFLPAVVNVARGELRFVGVTPRSPEELEALPRGWRALCLGAEAGIMTEANTQSGALSAKDECGAADAFYAAMAGMRHDLRLLIEYFLRLLKPFQDR
jgi:hypothetical protein